MAADILLYQADLVPVGADQDPASGDYPDDCEPVLTAIYGNTFKLPEGYIPKAGAKIMSLAEPTKKMSKSDENPNACILILDEKGTQIVKKFKRAITDSDMEVRYGRRQGRD